MLDRWIELNVNNGTNFLAKVLKKGGNLYLSKNERSLYKIRTIRENAPRPLKSQNFWFILPVPANLPYLNPYLNFCSMYPVKRVISRSVVEGSFCMLAQKLKS